MTRRPGNGARAMLIGIGALASFGLTVVFIDPKLAELAARAPDAVEWLGQTLTPIGKAHWWLAAFGLGAIGALAWRRRAGRRTAATLSWLIGALVFMILAIVVPGLITDIVKVLVGRARPRVGGGDDEFLLVAFGLDADHQSFPSGHATNLFALAFALAFFLPRLRWPLLIVAAMLSATRIVVEAHYLSDVAGGAVIARLAVYRLRDWCAGRRLVFRRLPDGTIGLRPTGARLVRRLRHLRAARCRARRSGAPDTSGISGAARC